MRHRANPKFWQFYAALPENIQRLADENYQLLKRDPHHPSLHFKKVGRYWSARVGIHYRAVAVEDGSDIVWFWIGHLDSVGLNSLPEHWAAPCLRRPLIPEVLGNACAPIGTALTPVLKAPG